MLACVTYLGNEEPTVQLLSPRAYDRSNRRRSRDDLESLRSIVRDAVAAHVDVAERPSVIRLHWVREELIAAG